jgi:serine/threonine-protein kinase
MTLVDAPAPQRLGHGSLIELTDREREILALIAQGNSNSRICALLHLSPRTVETHVRNLFTHLGLAESPECNRRVLAVLAYLRG